MQPCVYGRYAPVQPIINLQSYKRTPDSLKQRFKAFVRKPSLGAPGPLPSSILKYDFTWTFPDCKAVARGDPGLPVTPPPPPFVSGFFFF